jgi:hypothetical protein
MSARFVVPTAWSVPLSMHSVQSILRLPHVPMLLMATGLGRLGRAASALALVLLVVEEHQSYLLAGVAAAGLTFADAVTAPLKARLVDRFPPHFILLPLAGGQAAALVALLSMSTVGAELLIILTCVAGASSPPLSGCAKAIWPVLVPTRDHLASAYLVESALQQVLFFAGPLYVTAAVAAFSPAMSLAGIAGATVIGVMGFLRVVSRVAVADPSSAAPARRQIAGPLTVPTVAVVVVTTLLQSMVFGAFAVAFPAVSPDLGGLLVACGPCGGLVGLVVLGARPTAHFARLLLMSGLLLVPLVTGVLPVIAVCAFAAGMLVTPIAGIAYLLVDRAVPAVWRTEAFTWLSTANAAGTAIGSAVAGVAVEGLGVAGALVIPVAAAFGASLVGSLARPSRRSP